jgi:hypothetical protein
MYQELDLTEIIPDIGGTERYVMWQINGESSKTANPDGKNHET